MTAPGDQLPQRAGYAIARLVRDAGVAVCVVCILSTPALAQTTAPDWEHRLTAGDPTVRAAAEDALVKGAMRSLPVVKQLLDHADQDLRAAAFKVLQRIGPPAIPTLAGLLRHEDVDVRQRAVSELVDLAPHTESIQPSLRRALNDGDMVVAGDAARALGALGRSAAPSVGALVSTLSHDESYTRIYAAEALAAIGPAAAKAIPALARTLDDPVPGVRWAACEALGSIGPAARSAVPRLIEALEDEFLYVRIFAAGALGSIGSKEPRVLDALKAAAQDPRVRAEAVWALGRLTGVAPAEPPRVAPTTSVTPLLHARPPATGIPPVDWNTASGRNIVWSVELGDNTMGRPVAAGDTVYVGTDNGRPRNPAYSDDSGVLMAFRAADGQFLWQDLAARVEHRGLREFLLPSTTSAPLVDGNHLYYVTAECQLRALDPEGFRDGENSGPYRNEPFQDHAAADIVWELDMCGQLGVFPHEATNSEVLPVGDLLIVATSNGQNEGHTRVPAPRAPSLVAVNRHSGEVVWRAIGPGEDVLHGQWSSPAAAEINGRVQVFFGGGDGWLRSYDAMTGQEVWRFDGNPKDSRFLPRPGVLSRGSIIASPVFADGRVFVAMGQSPEHGNGPSFVHALSATGHGDVTTSALLWTSRDVGRVVGTPVAANGLLFVGDVGGHVYCLDAATGATVWKHDTFSPIWGSIMVAGDRLYVGNEDGLMTVLRAGRHKESIAQMQMDAPLYTRPEHVGDALFLATTSRMYLIRVKP